MRKKNNGITLIALIITIIILLILASLSIIIITDNSLFEHTKMAADKYNNAAKDEANEIEVLLNTVNLIGNQTEEPVEPEKPGEIITEKIKVGDWINYTLESKEHTMLISDTGATSEQKFNTSSYTGGWRVLHFDTETGNIEIVSAGSVAVLTLGRNVNNYSSFVDPYNNCVKTLNIMSSNYINEKYAVSARSVGTNPNEPDGTTATTSWRGFILKNADSYYTTDYNAMKSLNIHSIGADYWLGSRRIEGASVQNGANFHCNVVNADGTIGGTAWDDMRTYSGILFHVETTYSATVTGSYGVRPVITLKADCRIIEGDGKTKNTAWQLN